MKNLWAPWRMKYIKAEKSGGCIFCELPAQNKDKENYILLRQESCFAMLNMFPYNNGHLMLAPFKHTPNLDGLTEDELWQLMILLKRVLKLLGISIAPQGFNIGINLGEVAGAGIVDHLHIHVVPRWQGDTNFMPIVSNTKVIPELLEDTYNKLKEALDKTGT